MRLSLGRLGLPFARGGVWTPAKLASLGAYWWRADRGVTLREAGPDWPSQGSHVRGLDFDGSTNYVDLGDNALYDDTAPAVSYTFLAYVDASEQGSAAILYSEGNSSTNTQALVLELEQLAGQLRVALTDDSGTATISPIVIASAVTDEAWNVFTLVLGPSAWWIVSNGTEVLAPRAYTNAPAATTFNRSTIGALGRTTTGFHSTGPVAYGMRHDSALNLAQCRQVQQYIAEQVAGDGITLTIAGSESANANSPLNHWPFSEDAAGAEVSDIAGSVTGVRVPGDRVSNVDGHPSGLDAAQATTTEQPKFLKVRDEFGGRQAIETTATQEWLNATLAISQPFTVWAVCSLSTVASALYDLAGQISGSRWLMRYDATAQRWVIFAGTAVAQANFTATANSRMLIVMVFDGTSSKIRCNGTTIYSGSTNIGSTNMASFAIGRETGAGYWPGHIAEWGAVPGDLIANTDALANLEAYVDRWFGEIA